MTLRDYLKKLNDKVNENPELLELEVVSSADDEGNDYTRVSFDGEAGHFHSDDRDFISESVFSDWEDEDGDLEVNAFCIN